MKKKFVCVASVVTAMVAFATLEFSEVASFLCPDGESGLVTTLMGTILWSAPPQDREVQWLKSTGTQYILLQPGGYVTGIDIWIRPQYVSGGTQSGDVGTWNNGSRANTIRFNALKPSGESHSRNFIVVNASNSGQIYSGLSWDYRHVTVFGTAVTIDGNSYTMGAAWGDYHPGSFSSNFALFGCYNSSTKTVNCRSTYIGPCKIYGGTNGSNLVYDLIPYVKDGVGCMYDKLSDTYFYNQGTGEFIIGPDL
jgi:hypothetical protein